MWRVAYAEAPWSGLTTTAAVLLALAAVLVPVFPASPVVWSALLLGAFGLVARLARRAWTVAVLATRPAQAYELSRALRPRHGPTGREGSALAAALGRSADGCALDDSLRLLWQAVDALDPAVRP